MFSETCIAQYLSSLINYHLQEKKKCGKLFLNLHKELNYNFDIQELGLVTSQFQVIKK